MQQPSSRRTTRPAKDAQPSFAARFAVPLIAVVGVIVIALAYFYQYHGKQPQDISTAAANTQTAAPAVGVSLRFNEIMSSNENALPDDSGMYRDWIELINDSDAPLDITGWQIADNDKPGEDELFTFPQQTLQPGELVLVFASGSLQNRLGGAYHAPFKVSSSGETLYLIDAGGHLIETLEVPNIQANQVYARSPESGEWSVGGEYTPYLPNTKENHLALVSAAPSVHTDLVISEVMVKNATYFIDDGVYDYIELHNTGNHTVNLTGYSLTDNSAKPAKWIFPESSIEPGGYLVILATGEEDAVGRLRANFKLGSDGEELLLYNEQRQLLLRQSFGASDDDQAQSRLPDGSYTTALRPTPGYPNSDEGARQIDAQLLQRNQYGLIISEVMASTNIENIDKLSNDWIKLYNNTGQSIDLNGWGLSDDPDRPRKWQFPSGARIAPGEYLVVYANGADKNSVEQGKFNTNFNIAAKDCETILLATPSGEVVDRVPLTEQYGNVAYGRVGVNPGFYYFDQPTTSGASGGGRYSGKTQPVQFSRTGGIITESSITLELTAEDGAEIYYTTDCTEPTRSSNRYTGPLSINSTIVLRVVAYKDGFLPSYSSSSTYIFGKSHVLPVVSVVTAPDNLWSDARGIYVKGPNATAKFPYGSINKGANFWMRWEREGTVEYYGTDGEQILSQGMGLALHGQYSRAESQKAFSLTARSTYGDNLFRAPLFPNRDYTEYKSFLLRSSGNDVKYSRMVDSILTSAAEGTGVMYQDTVPVVVYLNGEFWGQYNMRERINPFSIAQWEGWDDRQNIDVVKANKDTRHGSNESFVDLINWLKANDAKTEANLAYVAERVDIDNYLTYVALEMYSANQDLLNVRRYRNAVSGDGKWRWILFDLDWAFWDDTNSIRRWLNPGGAGRENLTDNTLFVKLMQNPAMQDRFFTILGELMAGPFDTDALIAKIDERHALVYPEMGATFEKYEGSYKNWESYVERLRKYARSRPGKLLGYIQDQMKYTDTEMRKYFGTTMDKVGYQGGK